jgi:2-hydroxychromene-2-carboxylate isomerase
MNISDYSTKVKNLTDVLASIGAPVDWWRFSDYHLMDLEKTTASFVLQLQFEKHFPISKT